MRLVLRWTLNRVKGRNATTVGSRCEINTGYEEQIGKEGEPVSGSPSGFLMPVFFFFFQEPAGNVGRSFEYMNVLWGKYTRRHAGKQKGKGVRPRGNRDGKVANNSPPTPLLGHSRCESLWNILRGNRSTVLLLSFSLSLWNKGKLQTLVRDFWDFNCIFFV